MTHQVNIKSWKKFKTELFISIADFLTYKCEESVAICIKYGKLLLNQHINKAHLELCNQEETDTQLLLHV